MLMMLLSMGLFLRMESILESKEGQKQGGKKNWDLPEAES